jgi:hypothetical protein
MGILANASAGNVRNSLGISQLLGSRHDSHLNVGRAAIETFSMAREALRRHAAIAASLRDVGWKLSA